MIFESARENHDLIAAWLASPEKDQAIRDKEATSELLKLIEHRLGVKVDPTSRTGIRPGQDRALRADQRVPRRPDSPSRRRRFRSCPRRKPPISSRCCARSPQALRTKNAERYITVADEIEKEFNLGKLAIAPEHLGRVDTFRFEEKILLSHARSLIARGHYNQAHAIIADRERGFWVHRNVDRQLQWTACQGWSSLVSSLRKLGRNWERWEATPPTGSPPTRHPAAGTAPTLRSGTWKL